MTFKAAVEATPEIQHAWNRGLQALRGRDRDCVQAGDTRRLSGSVDLDTTLRETYPQRARWDYAIGYRRNTGGEIVYWIEVHPANSGSVTEVLAKLNWLKPWLENNAPRLDELRKEFIWISSGRTSFTNTSPQAKRMALQGLQCVGRRLSIAG